MAHPRLNAACELLTKLVGFDTTSKDSNLAFIDFVADYLSGHGITSTRVFNERSNKANLLATIGSTEQPDGIVLSGHSDVVPTEGQDWSQDPYQLTQRDQRLYGRGSTDMKGFIACVLAFVPEWINTPLKRPIHVALSYDEEVGCLGAPALIKELAKQCAPPAAVIVGEPTQMGIVNSHKSIQVFSTEVTGKAAHSSLPKAGLNAIMVAAGLTNFLQQVAEELQQSALPEARDSNTYTTINVGSIVGGTAINIVAERCVFQWEYRSVPEEDPREIANRFTKHIEREVLPKLQNIVPEARITTRQLAAVPGLKADPKSAALKLALELCGGSPQSIAYTTEAGLFSDAGMSPVVCGPGNIAQAHQPNEFIEISEIDRCLGFLTDITAHVTTKPAP